jgi:mono/diheme cytochrome c family protein
MHRLLALLSIPVSAALLAGCSGRTASPDALARGKYLAEQVSLCGDCHTPRAEHGELDRSRWLQGAILDLQPKRPVPDWADEAPGIAGLKRMGDAAVIRLLQRGTMPNGKQARPPMPQYRMSYEDAAAISDYLKALPANQERP